MASYETHDPKQTDDAAIDLKETVSNISTGQPQPDHHEMPLRKAIRQYSKIVGFLFSMTTSILLWGYDSVIVGSVTAIPAFQRDFGVWDVGEDDWIIPAIWLSLWSAFGPVGQVFG